MSGRQAELSGTGRQLMRMIPVTLLTGILFLLSHQEGSTLPLPSLPGLDKVIHAGAYAMLAASAIYAFPGDLRRRRPAMVAVLAAGYCLLFGLSDEYHQSFIAGRQASGWDLVADLVGILVITVSWLLLQRRKKGLRAE